MLSSCKFAIFDNDGTLMESMYYWRLCTLEYTLIHRMPIPEDMTLEELFSRSSREFSRVVSQSEQVSYEEVVREMERYMARHYLCDVNQKPGVEAFLARMKDHGARMCVATAAPRELCAQALERFDMLKYFEFVTDNYEVGMSKSDPNYFRAVANRLGAPGGECWVFEDTLHAIMGAKDAGMHVCAIEEYTSKRDREQIMNLADAYIVDYREPPLFDRDGK